MKNENNINATVNQESIPCQDSKAINEQIAPNVPEAMSTPEINEVIVRVKKRIKELDKLDFKTNEIKYETGKLLFELHEAKVYMQCGLKSWKEFCEIKFNKSHVYVKYLMDTYKLREELLSKELISEKIYISEPIARALSPEKVKNKLEEIWEEASNGDKDWEPDRKSIHDAIHKFCCEHFDVENLINTLSSDNVLRVTSQLHATKQKLSDENINQLLTQYEKYIRSFGNDSNTEENAEEIAD